MVVVLPVPLTPTTSTTPGRPSTLSARTRRSIVGSTSAISSSRSMSADLGRVGGALDAHARPQPLDELLRRGDAQVGREEGLLDLVPGVLVDVLPAEQREQSAAQRVVRAGEPGTQPLQPPRRRLGDLDLEQRLEVLGGELLRLGLGQLDHRGVGERLAHLDDVDGATRGVPWNGVVVADARRVVDARSRLGLDGARRSTPTAQGDDDDSRDEQEDEGEGDVQENGVHGRNPPTAVVGGFRP